jgi:acetyl/propionyl-CoA carboxylase alpha subunit
MFLLCSDADAPFVKLATEAVHIGHSLPSESYLNIPKIIAAAKATRSDGNL